MINFSRSGFPKSNFLARNKARNQGTHVNLKRAQVVTMVSLVEIWAMGPRYNRWTPWGPPCQMKFLLSGRVHKLVPGGVKFLRLFKAKIKKKTRGAAPGPPLTDGTLTDDHLTAPPPSIIPAPPFIIAYGDKCFFIELGSWTCAL